MLASHIGGKFSRSNFHAFHGIAILLLCAVVLTVSVGTACAETENLGTRLFGMILKKLSPQEAILQLSSPPTEDGKISWGYLECKNANVRDVNIQSLRIDCFDTRVMPASEWTDLSHLRVDEMLSCHADAVFTEKDLNAFLESRIFGHDKEWERVHVRMEDGRIYATAYYRLKIKFFQTKIKIEVSCALTGRGTELWLEDVKLKINNMETSAGIVERALQKLQPFIDTKSYGLPLYLSKVEISKGVCRVRSRILPKPLKKGLRWTRPSGENGVPFDEKI